jgi:flavin-dependent thymidylate synthase
MVVHLEVYGPVQLFWHWVRHRTQSYQGDTGRHIKFTINDVYIPADDEWGTRVRGPATVRKLREMLIEDHERQFERYETAIQMGVPVQFARRFLLFLGIYYTFDVVVNAHNLSKFLTVRRDFGAQFEIRQYAEVLYQEFFKPLYPGMAEAMFE